MGQVDSRPEYPNNASNSPKYNPINPDSTLITPKARAATVTTAPPKTRTDRANTGPVNTLNSPTKDDSISTSDNTILSTLGFMNEHELNMEVVVSTNDPVHIPSERSKYSPKFRSRSSSKSNGTTSPKKIAKGFKPIPPLSISETNTSTLGTRDDADLIPRPTTPKNIPRSVSPSTVFGSLVKSLSFGSQHSSKSPRDAPKLSKSAENPSMLDSEIFFTHEDDTPKRVDHGRRVTFALDTNDMETHVQEEQGVEFPKISVIPWQKLRDKGVMSEGPHFSLHKVLVYGNVYVQKSINCPAGEAPPANTVQKLHHEVEILTMMHHHINIVDFVGITISPTNQLSFLTKHCPFSLQGVLDRNMAFDFKGIAYGVLKGIQYVHQCGYVLGDLKPDKIWLDRNETPKLVDFGNTLSIKDAIETNKIVGTIGYMAPEIFLKNAIQTPQALDVFSYGAVVHYMVTRIDPAFKVQTTVPGKNIAEVARENANTPFDYTKITEPALRVLLTACLRINPAERPTTRRAVELLNFVKYKWHSDPSVLTRRKNQFDGEEDDEEGEEGGDNKDTNISNIDNKVQTESDNENYESENENFESENDNFNLDEDGGASGDELQRIQEGSDFK